MHKYNFSLFGVLLKLLFCVVTVQVSCISCDLGKSILLLLKDFTELYAIDFKIFCSFLRQKVNVITVASLQACVFNAAIVMVCVQTLKHNSDERWHPACATLVLTPCMQRSCLVLHLESAISNSNWTQLGLFKNSQCLYIFSFSKYEK